MSNVPPPPPGPLPGPGASSGRPAGFDDPTLGWVIVGVAVFINLLILLLLRYI